MRSAPNPQPAPPLDLAQFDGFTPGPWRVTRSNKPKFRHDRFIQSASNAFVAKGYGRDGDGANDADARLIAAAPALLAECRRLRAEIEQLRGILRELLADPDKDFDNGGPIPAYALVVRRDCYEAARAALSLQTAPDGQWGA